MTAQTNLPPFHLAFPVRDLEEARAFYGVKLGCPEGRSSPEWIDFNFYGHQIVAHLAPGECGHKATSAVDSHNVPVRHFGAVLSMEQWEDMAKRLTDAGTEFVIEPYIRFRARSANKPPCSSSTRRATRWNSRPSKPGFPVRQIISPIRFRAVERNIRTTFSGRNPWRIEPQGTAA